MGQLPHRINFGEEERAVAEIDIERKQGHGALWIWLIVAILVIAAIWWLFWGSSGRGMMAASGTVDSAGQMAAAPAAAPAPMIAAPAAVNEFMAFVDSSHAGSMDLDHVNTATGLRDLAAAGEALAARFSSPPSVAARADSLRSAADELQRDPESLRHAGITHRAFLVGASMLHDLESASNAGPGATDGVREAADGVNTDTPLLDQRAAVQRYWDAAAAAVRALDAGQ